MKGKFIKLLLALIAVLLLTFASGYGSEKETAGSGTASVVAQAQQGETGHKAQGGKTSGKQDGAQAGKSAESKKGSYTMQDIRKLKHTEIFAKGALEHIFDGTVNKKGKATGYHYDKVDGSKGEIISGTRSKEDRHGVYTAKVKVEGVQKNGFSSFYPDDWTPQEVVDAINTAYEDALSSSDNPHGDLWIGYSGDLEIDMYLSEQKKVITAYPIYRKE
jgi:hypothetical protein